MKKTWDFINVSEFVYCVGFRSSVQFAELKFALFAQVITLWKIKNFGERDCVYGTYAIMIFVDCYWLQIMSRN